MDINKVALIGRLVRKPDMRTSAKGRHVATFILKTTSGERDEFHRVVVGDRLADIAAEHLDHGGRVYLEGRLHHRSGARPSEVIVDEIIMLGHSHKRKSPASGGAASSRPIERKR